MPHAPRSSRQSGWAISMAAHGWSPSRARRPDLRRLHRGIAEHDRTPYPIALFYLVLIIAIGSRGCRGLKALLSLNRSFFSFFVFSLTTERFPSSDPPLSYHLYSGLLFAYSMNLFIILRLYSIRTIIKRLSRSRKSQRRKSHSRVYVSTSSRPRRLSRSALTTC